MIQVRFGQGRAAGALEQMAGADDPFQADLALDFAADGVVGLAEFQQHRRHVGVGDRQHDVEGAVVEQHFARDRCRPAIDPPPDRTPANGVQRSGHGWGDGGGLGDRVPQQQPAVLNRVGSANHRDLLRREVHRVDADFAVGKVGFGILFAFHGDLAAEVADRPDITDSVPFQLEHHIPIEGRSRMERIGQPEAELAAGAERPAELQTLKRAADLSRQRPDQFGIGMQAAAAVDIQVHPPATGVGPLAAAVGGDAGRIVPAVERIDPDQVAVVPHRPLDQVDAVGDIGRPQADGAIIDRRFGVLLGRDHDLRFGPPLGVMDRDLRVVQHARG